MPARMVSLNNPFAATSALAVTQPCAHTSLSSRRLAVNPSMISDQP